MESAPSPEVVQKALRKVLAAIEGSGFKAVAIGSLAHLAWGSKVSPGGVELLLPTNPAQRGAIQGAARGEGMQQVGGADSMSFRYNDAKLGGSAGVDLVEASTPLHQKAIERAQLSVVLQVQMKVAACEDLILLRAASAVPADRESIIELLRFNAGRIDAPYIKAQAEAAGIFDKVKSAWQEAKARG
jgi:predicted nucleotidyltransferase